jgi:hypothetical protein
MQNFSSIRCFPSFIIGGTQKSGTTALAALLSLHSNISLAAKKEVHFFDKSEAFRKGLEFYLRSFNFFNVSTERKGFLILICYRSIASALTINCMHRAEIEC